MIKLTARQTQVLDIIRRSIADTGFPPTRAEIAKELGFKSANAAEEHLKALARKGAIEMTPGASRGIRLADDAANDENQLPIVGQVAAGSPILAEQHIDDYCKIDKSFFSPEADYLLRVKGDSMIDAGIHDGDLLAVARRETAHHGELIVARIGDEVTVKHLDKTDKRHIRLLPANIDYSPIDVDLAEDDFSIEGLGVGVIRRVH